MSGWVQSRPWRSIDVNGGSRPHPFRAPGLPWYFFGEPLGTRAREEEHWQ
jgi:hypothetical protein